MTGSVESHHRLTSARAAPGSPTRSGWGPTPRQSDLPVGTRGPRRALSSIPQSEARSTGVSEGRSGGSSDQVVCTTHTRLHSTPLSTPVSPSPHGFHTCPHSLTLSTSVSAASTPTHTRLHCVHTQEGAATMSSAKGRPLLPTGQGSGLQQQPLAGGRPLAGPATSLVLLSQMTCHAALPRTWGRASGTAGLQLVLTLGTECGRCFPHVWEANEREVR